MAWVVFSVSAAILAVVATLLASATSLPGRHLAEVRAGWSARLTATCLELIGNLALFERRLLFIEADALVIALVYLGGMRFLYVRESECKGAVVSIAVQHTRASFPAYRSTKEFMGGMQC